MIRGMLVEGAGELGVNLDEGAVERLFKYKDFLLEYNEKVNLTSIVDDVDFVVKHFLDSLTLLPVIKMREGGARVIDIGTGAGLPGLVLKIVCDDIDLVLLDSLNKRVKFLDEAVRLLGLKNVKCVHGRAEELTRIDKSYRGGFDYAVARAVTNLKKLAGYCLPYVRAGGEFIAMKGRDYHEELEEARAAIAAFGGEVAEVREITLPGSEIVHSVIRVRRQ